LGYETLEQELNLAVRLPLLFAEKELNMTIMRIYAKEVLKRAQTSSAQLVIDALNTFGSSLKNSTQSVNANLALNKAEELQQLLTAQNQDQFRTQAEAILNWQITRGQAQGSQNEQDALVAETYLGQIQTAVQNYIAESDQASTQPAEQQTMDQVVQV